MQKSSLIRPFSLFRPSISVSAWLPYVLILVWVVPLLWMTSGEQSLVAHDEGLYANRARQMLDSGDWIHPWESPHFKTPGPYWLLATAFMLLGVNETAARLPSILASLISAFLFYEIGKILLNQRAALLATFCLWTSFLWLQYSRFATPDLPFLCCVCLGILGLLKGEREEGRSRDQWVFVAGLSLGFSVLIRSLMVALPIVALSPYLVFNHRRHGHLTNLSLYLGFGIGLLPTLIWIGLCWSRFGVEIVNSLLGFVVNLSGDQRHNHGPFYYVWNLAVNGFPWSEFGLGGLVLVLRDNRFGFYRWILAGSPISLLGLISTFSTRIPHYGLLMYPFLALLAGVVLERLCQPFQSWGGGQKRWIVGLNVGIFILGLLFLGAGLMVGLNWVGLDGETSGSVGQYGAIAAALGSGWSLGSGFWLLGGGMGSRIQSIPGWIAGLLLGSWLALATAGLTGLLGNANPELKLFIEQPEVHQILEQEVVHFGSLQGKMGVLLRFYTPHLGLQGEELGDLPAKGYAWVRVEQLELLTEMGRDYESIGEVRDWYLIRFKAR